MTETATSTLYDAENRTAMHGAIHLKKAPVVFKHHVTDVNSLEVHLKSATIVVTVFDAVTSQAADAPLHLGFETSLERGFQIGMHCEAGKTRPVNKTAEEATSIVRHSSLAINGDVVHQVEVVAEHPRVPFKLEAHNVPGACRLINEWELLSGNQQPNKRGCAGTCDLTMSSIPASFTACNVALPAPFVMLSLTLTVKFCDMLVYKFQTIKIWLLAGFGCPRLSVSKPFICEIFAFAWFRCADRFISSFGILGYGKGWLPVACWNLCTFASS
jgi:hypothetical protein